MKKKWLIIALAMVFALGFMGCDDQKEKTVEPEDPHIQEMVQPEEETTAPEAAEAASNTQTITMGNVQMQIPSKWTQDNNESSEMTHVYKTADGNTVFTIEAMQAPAEVDSAVLGETTEEYISELGYAEIGYYDTTVGSSIEGKIIPVDKGDNPHGKYEQIITIGKGKTVVAICCEQSTDDFTEFNNALETVKFIN